MRPQIWVDRIDFGVYRGLMRRSALTIGILLLAVLTGCAGGAGDDRGGSLVASAVPADVDAASDAVAQVQAQTWLDAAALPPGAIRSSYATGAFNSFQGWPCRPVAQLEGYWTIPDMTVAQAANWLMANPPADLVTTAVGAIADDPTVDGATVGFIPADDSQQGVVFTIAKRDDGVAVRAEVAALTASAVCPTLPDGGQLGKPGQG